MIQLFSFVLSFENNAHQHFLPTVETKDYNVMIDGENSFDQPGKNSLRTYDSFQKIVTGQGYD